MASGPPIVLTTDFGLSDPYVGVMKGVILGINPGAKIVDLTHQVQPQNLIHASFILKTSYAFFPQDSIHVAVVDPGVGTSRKAILLASPVGVFVAPDNGILSGVLEPFLDRRPTGGGTVSVPAGCTAYELTKPDFQLHPVSSTFHGRDIFSPAAAHLSLGAAPETFGPPLQELVWLPFPQPSVRGNQITGQVICADHFGNLVTNIPGTMVQGKDRAVVEYRSHRLKGLHRTFQQNPDHPAGEPLALVGSNGYLEIAVPNGNAASLLAGGPGDVVAVDTG